MTDTNTLYTHIYFYTTVYTQILIYLPEILICLLDSQFLIHIQILFYYPKFSNDKQKKKWTQKFKEDLSQLRMESTPGTLGSVPVSYLLLFYDYSLYTFQWEFD